MPHAWQRTVRCASWPRATMDSNFCMASLLASVSSPPAVSGKVITSTPHDRHILLKIECCNQRAWIRRSADVTGPTVSNGPDV